MKPRSDSLSNTKKMKKDKNRMTRKNLSSSRGLLKRPAIQLVCVSYTMYTRINTFLLTRRAEYHGLARGYLLGEKWSWINY